MGLNETSRVAYNLGETQTCNNFFFLFKLTCTFRSLRSLAKSQCVLRGGKLSSPETLLYPSISNYFFFCYGKAVNLLPMWNLDLSSVKFS